MRFILLLLFITIFSYSTPIKNSKDSLIFYCGTTMAPAMAEIAKQFEKEFNCKIEILQGGSQALYDSLKSSKIGDLYLPGSDTYIKKYKKDGFFERSEDIGFNQIVMFVKKGNPKNIKTLDDLLRDDIGIVIGNPEFGSVGKNTKKVLELKGGKEFYYKIFDKAVSIESDSRLMNRYLLNRYVDVVINWKASIIRDKLDLEIVYIDEKYALKKRLLLTLLSFSKKRDLANKFIDYTLSKKGDKILKRYSLK